MNQLRFGYGDMAASILLPDRDGDVVDLSQQAIAGHALVLWFVRGSVAKDAIARCAALQERFDAVEARLYAVGVGALPAGTLSAIERAGVPLLTDPQNRVAAAFGDGAAPFVVFDAGARIIAAVAKADAALAVCERRYEACPPVAVEHGAPVLILEDLLKPAFCETLIGQWEAGQKVDNAVAAENAQHADASVKRRRDVYVTDRGTYEFLAERFRRRVFPEIRRAFQAGMVSFEVPRIGCYDARDGGHFGAHATTARRTPRTAASPCRST